MPIVLNGTDGITQADQFNSDSTFGFKNRIINGGFTINQRGYVTNTSLTSGSYGHDRWKGGASNGTYTFTQASAGVNTTITITAGSIIQVIEGANLPEGGTYVLSWTGTAQGKIGAGSFGASGITGTITAGTDTNIEFNTGTCGNVQLEVGSTATSFDYRPFGTELALCQRYYEKSYNVDVVPATNTGAGRVFVTALYQSAGLLDYGGSVPFRVSKRANPTISYWREDGTSGSWEWATAAGSGNLTAILTNRVGTTAFSTYATGSGFTNTPFVISGHWVASIEL